jgi:anti-sigma B factor antagonist
MAFELPLARPYVEPEGDATVVYFTGRNVSLDEHSLRRNRDFLFALAERLDRTRLILDFTNVDLVSSFVLDTLVSLHWKLQTRGRRLILRNLGRELYGVFAAAQLNAFLELRAAWSAPGA